VLPAAPEGRCEVARARCSEPLPAAAPIASAAHPDAHARAAARRGPAAARSPAAERPAADRCAPAGEPGVRLPAEPEPAEAPWLAAPRLEAVPQQLAVVPPRAPGAEHPARSASSRSARAAHARDGHPAPRASAASHQPAARGECRHRAADRPDCLSPGRGARHRPAAPVRHPARSPNHRAGPDRRRPAAPVAPACSERVAHHRRPHRAVGRSGPAAPRRRTAGMDAPRCRAATRPAPA